MIACDGYLYVQARDEDGNPLRYAEPRRCAYPVSQTLHRCGDCLRVIDGDTACDGCDGRLIETERWCEIHRLSARDIAYSRGVVLPAPSQRELLAEALGIRPDDDRDLPLIALNDAVEDTRR